MCLVKNTKHALLKGVCYFQFSMQFSFNLYSSLLLIFFVHIMVYACMLWRRSYKQESLSDRLLAWFLLVAALYVVPWMTGFAGWYIEGTVYREILFIHLLYMACSLARFSILCKEHNQFSVSVFKERYPAFCTGCIVFVMESYYCYYR